MAKGRTKQSTGTGALMVLGYVITIVGLLAIAGVGFYLWQKDKTVTPSTTNTVPTQNQTSTNTVPTPTNQPTDYLPNDPRTLLTPNNLAQYLEGAAMCDVVFNTDEPNASVTFSDETLGLSVGIPYNPNWGSADYKVNPFDLLADTMIFTPDSQPDDPILRGSQLNFGPMSVGEGCGWGRAYYLQFVPARSITQAKESLTSNPDVLFTQEPKEVSINGKKAVQYATAGLCSPVSFEVIGEKYNYLMAPVCGSGESSEVDFLSDIIRSMEFI